MTKMEKVIKGLECRLDINGSKYEHCLTCDYRHDIDHCQWACQPDGILEDALALLQSYEPKLVHVTADINRRNVGECPNCGKMINSGDYPNYCGRCGQAVKWE